MFFDFKIDMGLLIFFKKVSDTKLIFLKNSMKRRRKKKGFNLLQEYRFLDMISMVKVKHKSQSKKLTRVGSRPIRPQALDATPEQP